VLIDYFATQYKVDSFLLPLMIQSTNKCVNQQLLTWYKWNLFLLAVTTSTLSQCFVDAFVIMMGWEQPSKLSWSSWLLVACL